MKKKKKTIAILLVILIIISVLIYFLAKGKKSTGYANSAKIPDYARMNNNRVVKTESGSCCYYIKDGKWYNVYNWSAVVRRLGNNADQIIPVVPDSLHSDLPHNPAKLSWDIK